MKKNKTLLFIAFCLMASCRRNPIERLSDPVPDGAVPQSSGIFMLYDNELKTGGGVGLIPLGDNQTVDVGNRDNPHDGSQIKYEWNGQPVNAQQLFAGFLLPITIDVAQVPSSIPRDFSAGGYTQLKMRIRGTLGAENALRIEGPGTGTSTPARVEITAANLSRDWQEITLAVPTADFNAVRIFVTFTIQYTQPPRTTNPGTGGVIYVDDLRYEK